MTKRFLAVWIVVVLALAALVLAGCGGKKATTTPAETQTPASSTSKVSTPSSTSSVATQSGGSSSELSSILGKAAAFSSVKFDSTTTGPNFPSTTNKVYWKKSKMRIEVSAQGMNSILFVDTANRTLYMYIPAQNTASKLDYGQAPSTITDAINSILSNNPTVLGSETIDGKSCLVIQYSSNGTTTKEWLWKDNGFPLKIEVSGTGGVTTTTNQNVDFSDIPDSMFELPANAQIVNLGGGGLPSGLPTNLPTALPTNLPGGLPTSLPSGLPTALPSGFPTALPSGFPTALPSGLPTNLPTQ